MKIKIPPIGTWFKNQKPQQQNTQQPTLPEPDFTDNWKSERYERNVVGGIEHLKQGKTITIYDDGRGFELACDIKRRFILEYQKQLSEKIKIEGGNIITLRIENAPYQYIEKYNTVKL